MGAQTSKRDKINSVTNSDKSSHRKKYLPQTNGATTNGTGDDPRSPSIEEHPVELPTFTARQKELVTETWRLVQEDMAKVGVVMFIKLFETHPEVQNVFMPFRGQSKESLKDSAQLKSHALRVMGTVDKCITRFQDPVKVKDMLHELGARHVMYNAKVDYMDLIGPQFIWAIEPVLGDRWTPEVEQAWSDLFKFVSYIMKDAMSF
ncbi:neuroglobin-like [Physella acuta]|uniref:neuroglobin-like n=1 Tax=Physella acuta TaxID=109671 RepID=UPI0027DDE7A2|nr:neuroglobin-like [Physella acuta]